MVGNIPDMPTRIGPKKPIRLFLAEWRESRQLTQQQLADRLETSDVTISRWETGKRRPDDDAKSAIAWVLGIEVVDLYRHPDQPSADALLRGQPIDIQDQGLRVIEALVAGRRR
jgi:transcriptional regulator with XRE-family HTH domain